MNKNICIFCDIRYRQNKFAFQLYAFVCILLKCIDSCFFVYRVLMALSIYYPELLLNVKFSVRVITVIILSLFMFMYLYIA